MRVDRLVNVFVGKDGVIVSGFLIDNEYSVNRDIGHLNLRILKHSINVWYVYTLWMDNTFCFSKIGFVCSLAKNSLLNC